MSCRVLARGVEEYLMNYIVAEAERRGLETVAGTYIPTPKNTMVKQFFANFGFLKTGETAGGTTRWQLQVRDYSHRKTYISPELVEQALVGAL